jgi:hypothetical protein
LPKLPPKNFAINAFKKIPGTFDSSTVQTLPAPFRTSRKYNS